MQYACYISENIQEKFQNYHSHKVITNVNKEEREHFFKDKKGKNHSQIYQPFSHFFKQKNKYFFPNYLLFIWERMGVETTLSVRYLVTVKLNFSDFQGKSLLLTLI